MKLILKRYDREKNQYVADKHSGSWCLVDPFVGCGIKMPTEPYDETEYDRIAESLVGKEVTIEESCWSERHQMYLPNEGQIITN